MKKQIKACGKTLNYKVVRCKHLWFFVLQMVITIRALASVAGARCHFRCRPRYPQFRLLRGFEPPHPLELDHPRPPIPKTRRHLGTLVQTFALLWHDHAGVLYHGGSKSEPVQLHVHVHAHGHGRDHGHVHVHDELKAMLWIIRKMLI